MSYKRCGTFRRVWDCHGECSVGSVESHLCLSVGFVRGLCPWVTRNGKEDDVFRRCIVGTLPFRLSCCCYAVLSISPEARSVAFLLFFYSAWCYWSVALFFVFLLRLVLLLCGKFVSGRFSSSAVFIGLRIRPEVVMSRCLAPRL